MFTIICDYEKDFQILQGSQDSLYVYDKGEDTIRSVIEVGRIPEPTFCDMELEDLLDAYDNYDYSGELNNGSAYCFWKLRG